MIDKAKAEKVVGLGGCEWCTVRFTTGYYSKCEARTAVEAVLGSPRDWQATCTLCLGVLQRVAEHADKAVEAAAPYGDGLCGAGMSIVVAGALMVREAAAEAVLGKARTSVKEALRMMLRPVLGIDEPAPDDQLGALMLTVSVDAPDQGELATLGKRKRGDDAGPARVAQAVARLSVSELERLASRLIVPGVQGARVDVACSRDSVFLVGRYRKLSRVMPQTPWLIDGRRKGVSSVEEVLAEAARDQFAAFRSAKFLASGREDCDVRMLGDGRPFALEIVDPTRLRGALSTDTFADAVRRVSTQLGAPVEVRGVERADKKAAQAVDAAAQSKTKSYACIVWFQQSISPDQARKLDDIVDLEIQQKTPVRVMHTRSLHTRPRFIHSLRLTLLNAHFADLRLTTAAGTYIKEFVHGDFGRTTPSLGDLLGTRADILQLDVLAVDFNDARGSES